MKKYIILLRKIDFSDLYQYGYLYFNRDLMVEIDCNPEDLSKNREIFNKLFQYSNPFDYTFSYVLIHYQSDNISNKLEIENVLNIYALDNEAQREFSTSFGDDIIINPPIWTEFILDQQINNSIFASKRGIKNIWKIFDIKDPIEKYEKVVDDFIINEVITELYYNTRPIGEIPVWAYLLRYERHSFYPKTTKGYFMDTVHTFVNFLNKGELDSIEGKAEIFHFIEQLPDINFKEIEDRIYNSDKSRGFLLKTVEVSPIFNFLEVATLFFILKNTFSEKIDLNNKTSIDIINYSRKNYNDSFNLASYLLGLSLGQEKTYDCLYSTLPLPIIRKRIIKEPRSIETKTIDENKTSVPVPKNNEHIIIKLKDCKLNKKQLIEIQSIYSECNSHISEDFYSQISKTPGIGQKKIECIKKALNTEINSNQEQSQISTKSKTKQIDLQLNLEISPEPKEFNILSLNCAPINDRDKISRLKQLWNLAIDKKKNKEEAIKFFINTCKKEGRGGNNNFKILQGYFTEEVAKAFEEEIRGKYNP